MPKYCFSGCTALTTVSFPGIQTIGEGAFLNCSALTGELTIPNGANIAYRAFDGCSGITSIVLHSGMTSGDNWHNGCFLSMSGVTSVSIIDDGNHTIPANVFGGASFSTAGVTLTIPESITAIGDGAFYHANFPKNLDLSQFTSIGSHAFEGNTTLANNGVTFAEKTTIGASAFENCTALTGELTIPSGASIRTYAFNGCSGVTSLKIHTGTSTSPTTSGESNWYHGCFIEMTGVESVELIDDENGNHTIPANMFGYAKFKENVTLTIPKTITIIGGHAFKGANFPATIDFSQFTEYGDGAFENNTAFIGNKDSVISVKVPTSAKSVTVGSRAFWNTGATEIDIYPNMDYSGCEPPDKYYEYGNGGPYNGKSITKIVFENSITSIPDYVFFKASDIPSTCTVTWPTNPITHIGNGAFCGVQFTAALPKEMSGEGTIGEYAYARNNMSGEITIPTG